MTWEEKTEMIKLSNQANDKESRQKFLKYVVEKLPIFDVQAYDMFITGFSIVSSEMKEDEEYHKIIYSQIKQYEPKLSEISFRSSLRIEMYKITCEKDLDINEKIL